MADILLKKHHGRWLDDQVPNFYGKPCPSRATNECHLHSRSSPGAIRQHPGWSRRGARTELFKKQWTFLYPICSMVLVYLPTKLGDLCKAHVGKYSSTMEHMGIFCWEWVWAILISWFFAAKKELFMSNRRWQVSMLWGNCFNIKSISQSDLKLAEDVHHFFQLPSTKSWNGLTHLGMKECNTYKVHHR